MNTSVIRASLFAFLILLSAAAAFAGDDDLSAIQDNSFLVEEAYNQEAGVVQHISLFTFDPRSHAWVYTFTQEWPVRTQTHQLSYTIPIVSDAQRGVGDVLLNYRYQLVGSGETKLAIAPRLTVSLPTGSASKGFGRGHAGLQAGVPISRVLTSRLISHTDFGATVYSGGGGRDLALGQSVIYALNGRVHLMLESVWTQTRFRGAVDTQLLVSPGVRWAYNFESGLQVVPGLAWAIGAGPSHGERWVVGYLSFEHPFGKRPRG